MLLKLRPFAAVRSIGRTAQAAALLIASATAAEAADGKLVNRGSNTPIAGATITVVGATITATTDAEGKFSLTPEPRPPFTVIVILPGGQLAKPLVVEKLSGLLTLTVDSAVNEEITVTTGVAPSIDASAGAALTVLSSREIALRVPANLMGAVEVVPGVNQVSEGQAAVPAIRGLARGRTLILIDGSRVTSERRVGPSATFMDPAMVEGIDIARGPGSVAYGSDSFGGVISVRTKRPPRSGTQFGGSLTLGAGVPEQRGEGTISKGFGQGGVLFSLHGRNAEDYDGPEGDVLNSGWADSGFLIRGRAARRGRAVQCRARERLRPRHRASAQQLERCALLLSVRELEPVHHGLRPDQRRRHRRWSRSPVSSGPSNSEPIRIAFRPRPAPGTSPRGHLGQ